MNETVRKAEAWNFWYDPRFGSICWPLSAGLAVYESRLYWAVFSAFWTGVSMTLGSGIAVASVCGLLGVVVWVAPALATTLVTIVGCVAGLIMLSVIL